MALDGAFGQRELVRCRCRGLFVFDARLDAARGRALGRCHFGRRGCPRQLAAEVVEVPGLGRQNLSCFRGGGGLCCGLVRHLQHGASPQTVHVTLNECIRVGAHHGDQHLVERHASRLVRVGKAACGVACLHCHTVCRCGAGRGRARRGRSCRRLAGAGRCSWAGCWHLGCRRCRNLGCRCDRRRCAAHAGRVEQHGVAANDAARSPVGIQHQVQEGLIHRPVAGQAQHGSAVGAALQLYLQVVHGLRVFHALGTEDFGGCRCGTQRVGFCGGDLWQVDFSAQGFAQGRLHGDAAQCQRRRVAGVEASASHGRGRQDRKFPTMHVCQQLMRILCGSDERCFFCHGLVPPRRVKICKKHHSINVLH